MRFSVVSEPSSSYVPLESSGSPLAAASGDGQANSTCSDAAAACSTEPNIKLSYTAQAQANKSWTTSSSKISQQESPRSVLAPSKLGGGAQPSKSSSMNLL